MAFNDIFPHFGSAGSLLSGLQVLTRSPLFTRLWVLIFGETQESSPEGFSARRSATWADLPNLLLVMLKVLLEIRDRLREIKEGIDYCGHWLELITDDRLRAAFAEAGLDWDSDLSNADPEDRRRDASASEES